MYNKNYSNMHDSNKYIRVQDALQQTYVLVPESDFIKHCKEYNEVNSQLDLEKRKLGRLEVTNIDINRSFAKLQKAFKEDVNRARIQQRQEDAKVYAHWRDKSKELIQENKELHRALHVMSNNQWNDNGVDWKKKYDTLVNAIDTPINILENINKGHIYEEITIKYPEDNKNSNVF